MVWTGPDGEAVELPKLTAALARKMNAVRGAAGPEEAWRREHEFLREVLPADYLAAVLDGEAFEEIDLSELDRAFAGVVSAYTAPAAQAQAAQARTALEAIDGEVLDKIGGLVAAVERMQRMQAPRKGFRVQR